MGELFFISISFLRSSQRTPVCAALFEMPTESAMVWCCRELARGGYGYGPKYADMVGMIMPTKAGVNLGIA